MSENLEILTALEPHTAEILSVIDRERLFKPGRESSFDRKSELSADYLARVNGDDYVVSISDAEMTSSDVTRDIAYASRYDTYATNTVESRKWIARNRKLHRVMSTFRPLYKGYVLVAPRDAFDIYQSNDEMLSRGMVGYSLRHGQSAILHATGNMPDDHEFFLRAVRAVNLDNHIDRKTLFTTQEQRDHAEIYHPIIDTLEQLIKRDGVSSTKALDRYADQLEENGDISKQIALTLDISAQVEQVTKTNPMFATYHLGENSHLLIERRGNGKRSSIKVTYEYVSDGETITRKYEQPWAHPNILLVDVPVKSHSSHDRDHRLFALSQSNALEINAVLSKLLIS